MRRSTNGPAERRTSYSLSTHVCQFGILPDEQEERLGEGQSDNARDKKGEDDDTRSLGIESGQVRRGRGVCGIAQGVQRTGRADDESSIDHGVLHKVLCRK